MGCILFASSLYSFGSRMHNSTGSREACPSELMIEFTVAAKDFKKAIRFILAGRKEYMDKDTAPISLR